MTFQCFDIKFRRFFEGTGPQGGGQGRCCWALISGTDVSMKKRRNKTKNDFPGDGPPLPHAPGKKYAVRANPSLRQCQDIARGLSLLCRRCRCVPIPTKGNDRITHPPQHHSCALPHIVLAVHVVGLLFSGKALNHCAASSRACLLAMQGRTHHVVTTLEENQPAARYSGRVACIPVSGF